MANFIAFFERVSTSIVVNDIQRERGCQEAWQSCIIPIMSVHSKWSTIKRQKGITDKKKGLAFSKLTKAISAAAHSGADPDSNFKLRLLIEKARAINMPKENISRAIAK